MTDGKLIRLLVKDSPLDLNYGEIVEHRRTLDLRAGVLRRVTEWRRRVAARCASPAPAGLAGPPVDRRHPVPGRGHRRPRRPTWPCSPDLLANEATPPATATRARRRRSPSPCSASWRSADGRRPRAPDQAQPAARRRRHGPRARGPRHQHRGHRGQRRPGPVHPGRADPAGRRPEADQVHRLRLVVAALGARRCATRSRPRWPPPSWPAGTAWSVSSASCWTSTGTRRRRDRRRRRAAAGRAGRHVPRPAGRPARRAPADPGEGADRPGYDGHTFWDTETYVLPVLTYTAPHAVRTRCAGGTRSSTWPGTGRRCWASAGRRSRGGPSAVRSALACGDGGLPHQRRHRRRRRPLLQRHPGRRLRPRLRGRLLIETARLWASLGTSTSSTASASTA